MSLKAVFLTFETDFFTNFSAMKFYGPDRQTHYFRDFFCFFPAGCGPGVPGRVMKTPNPIRKGES